MSRCFLRLIWEPIAPQPNRDPSRPSNTKARPLHGCSSYSLPQFSAFFLIPPRALPSFLRKHRFRALLRNALRRPSSTYRCLIQNHPSTFNTHFEYLPQSILHPSDQTSSSQTLQRTTNPTSITMATPLATIPQDAIQRLVRELKLTLDELENPAAYAMPDPEEQEDEVSNAEAESVFDGAAPSVSTRTDHEDVTAVPPGPALVNAEDETYTMDFIWVVRYVGSLLSSRHVLLHLFATLLHIPRYSHNLPSASTPLNPSSKTSLFRLLIPFHPSRAPIHFHNHANTKQVNSPTRDLPTPTRTPLQRPSHSRQSHSRQITNNSAPSL